LRLPLVGLFNVLPRRRRVQSAFARFGIVIQGM
jgi:hypothetical protein